MQPQSVFSLFPYALLLIKLSVDPTVLLFSVMDKTNQPTAGFSFYFLFPGRFLFKTHFLPNCVIFCK